MSSPIILITGATRGIGLAAAKQLVARGASVIIGSRDRSRAEAAAREIGAAWLQLDITDPASVSAAVQTLRHQHGHLDVLVNNAALNMLTQQLSAGLPDLMVNSMCPGWCRTEMGGSEAPLSAEEGADTLVWLALDAPHSLRGNFVKQRKIIAW